MMSSKRSTYASLALWLLSINLLFITLEASSAGNGCDNPPASPTNKPKHHKSKHHHKHHKSTESSPPPKLPLPSPPKLPLPTPPKPYISPLPPLPFVPSPPKTLPSPPKPFFPLPPKPFFPLPPKPYFPTPPLTPYITPPKMETCPRDALKLEVCSSVLGGLVGIISGTPPKKPCCRLFGGLMDLEAAVCLCTAIKANVLGLNLNVPLSLSLVLNVCDRSVPPGFLCA